MVGDNWDVLTLSLSAAPPPKVNRQIMFITFGSGKNQSLHSSFLRLIWFLFFSAELHSTMCVFLRRIPCRIRLLYKPKKVRTCLPSENRNDANTFSVCFTPLRAEKPVMHMHLCGTFDAKPEHFGIPVKRCIFFSFARRLKRERKLIWIDAISAEINAFF